MSRSLHCPNVPSRPRRAMVRTSGDPTLGLSRLDLWLVANSQRVEYKICGRWGSRSSSWCKGEWFDASIARGAYSPRRCGGLVGSQPRLGCHDQRPGELSGVDRLQWARPPCRRALCLGRAGVRDGEERGSQGVRHLTDTTPTTVYQFSTQVDDYWDRGPLGLALDPNFQPARTSTSSTRTTRRSAGRLRNGTTPARPPRQRRPTAV